MAENAQYRLRESLTELADYLNKSYFRTIQRDVYRCAAECCDEKKPSADQVNRCVKLCNLEINQAQTFLQKELTQFQKPLQRCLKVCLNRLKNRVTANTSESQVKVYEACTITCIDEHIQLMPSTKRRIADTLTKNT